MTAEDPYKLQSFNPEHVKTQKIKSVFIQEAVKSPGKTISYKRNSTRGFFNTDGTLKKSVKVINRSTGTQDSTTILYFYLNGKPEREELYHKSGNQITYFLYPKESITERKIVKQDAPSSKFNLESTYRFELGPLDVNERLATETKDNELMAKFVNVYDSEDRLIESKHIHLEQYPNYTVSTKWNYEFGKLVDMKITTEKVEDLYEISYGKNSIIKMIQHSSNGTMTEAVEYFYFNGNIESVLRIEPNSSDLEITNYSYEFY